jgi:hypothetical protein
MILRMGQKSQERPLRETPASLITTVVLLEPRSCWKALTYGHCWTIRQRLHITKSHLRSYGMLLTPRRVISMVPLLECADTKNAVFSIFRGLGAGQAIEDAFILSNLLGKVGSAAGVEKAFQAYDAVRRPQRQMAATTRRETASICESENAQLVSDLDLLGRTL